MERLLPLGAVRQRLEVLYEELVTASASETRDHKAVERCTIEIQEILGLSSTAFARKLGVSDQTVLRWRKHPPGYENSVPGELALSKLRQLIEVCENPTDLPDQLPAAYFRAVANSRRPSVSYLRLLVKIQELLGIELNEGTCLAVIRNLDEVAE